MKKPRVKTAAKRRRAVLAGEYAGGLAADMLLLFNTKIFVCAPAGLDKRFRAGD